MRSSRLFIKICVGILFGPHDLDVDNFEIIDFSSSSSTGFKKREKLFLLRRNSEKWVSTLGILASTEFNIYKKIIKTVTHIFTACIREIFVKNIFRYGVGLFRNVDNITNAFPSLFRVVFVIFKKF